ncbi:LOG family protein [bacterium]|jgi:uncharacterized protein (TIGR00730 family)|nr:LOG family protein [bacterium]
MDKNLIIKDLENLCKKHNLTHSDELFDSITTLLRSSTEHPDSADHKLISTSLSELRKAFNLFYRYKDIRKIALFGSARTKSDNPEYRLAEQFSGLATSSGFMVITGAGPGIMEAGNKGARVNMSFGVNIFLPFEQSANDYIKNDSKLVSFKYFFNRKLIFIKESDATVLFPGGFGTHDEGFEVLTLIQTGRCAPRPVVLICEEGNDYWDVWEDFVQRSLKEQGYISKYDLGLYKKFHNNSDAMAYINNFYSVYHSIRYFKDHSIIRLNKKLSPQQLNDVNKAFGYLAETGKIEQKHSRFLPEDNSQYPQKYRLIFHFNKIHYGRLIKMIHFLNTFS